MIFSPNTQPGAVINSGAWQKFTPTSGTVRWNDDGGEFPDISWATLIAGHGNESISQIRLQTGCSGGYGENTVTQADDLTVVAEGTKSNFDFGQN